MTKAKINTGVDFSKSKNATFVLGDGGAQTASLAQSFNDTLNKLAATVTQPAAAPAPAPIVINQTPASTTSTPTPASTIPVPVTTSATSTNKWIWGVVIAAIAAGLWLFTKNK